MHRHAEDRKESARKLGFGPYVSEMAYRPGQFDDRAAELSRGDREDYAKAHGRPWPKVVHVPGPPLALEVERVVNTWHVVEVYPVDQWDFYNGVAEPASTAAHLAGPFPTMEDADAARAAILTDARNMQWVRTWTSDPFAFTDHRRIYCRACGERVPPSDDADLCRECERGEADHQHRVHRREPVLVAGDETGRRGEAWERILAVLREERGDLGPPDPWAYLRGPGRPKADLSRRKRCDTGPWPRVCRGCPDCRGIRSMWARP